jgi:3-hydroxybutyryl-CoA dehydrogenase
MAPLLEKLDAEFIRPGHLGMFSGKGFYNYPNPAYESANFLK